MEGLIMDYQLNVPAILRRGEQLFGDREIVDPASRQVLAPLHVRRVRAARAAARRSAAQ